MKSSLDGRKIITIAILAVIYLGVARFGLTLATVSMSVTLVWPATGLAIAALYIGGMRLWPGIWLGAFFANASTPNVPLAVAFAIATGNTLEAVCASALLCRKGFQPRLDRVVDVLQLAAAAIASTAPCAVAGSVALWAGGLIPSDALASTSRIWFVGDLMGALIVLPLLSTLSQKIDRPKIADRPFEAVALGACLLLVSAGAFGLVSVASLAPVLRPYTVFPILIWAALRFGPRGAACANATVSMTSVWATSHGMGPFVGATLNESLLSLQTFMGFVALTPLMLAAAVAERDRAVGALEDFIAIASHELKTPLTPLTLNVQRLKRILSSSTSVGGALESSERQISRLSQLVADLLDVTRSQSGKLAIELEEIDLSAVVRDVAEGMREQMAASRCELNVEVEVPLPCTLDRARVEQVVVNLLTNAMKFGVGKPVKVSVARIGDVARLQIRDEGTGIDVADQAHIFDRFRRARKSRHISGLGLGLYIVRQIVDAHGGEIRVQSALESGSTFVVDWPIGAVLRSVKSRVS